MFETGETRGGVQDTARIYSFQMWTVAGAEPIQQSKWELN